MDVLRTPDSRFADLRDFPFEPHYHSVSQPPGTELRMHYVDEGPRAGAPVLLLHGEPSWSYLYRKMIPPLVDAGRRVIAPDHIGFGRSDKPTALADYSYANHVAWCLEVLRGLDLGGVTLFCQDWGGPIGLSLVAAESDRFSAVVAANTILPTAQAPPLGEVEGWPGEIIEMWMETARSAPELPVGDIVQGVTLDELPRKWSPRTTPPFPTSPTRPGLALFLRSSRSTPTTKAPFTTAACGRCWSHSRNPS